MSGESVAEKRSKKKNDKRKSKSKESLDIVDIMEKIIIFIDTITIILSSSCFISIERHIIPKLITRDFRDFVKLLIYAYISMLSVKPKKRDKYLLSGQDLQHRIPAT